MASATAVAERHGEGSSERGAQSPRNGLQALVSNAKEREGGEGPHRGPNRAEMKRSGVGGEVRRRGVDRRSRRRALLGSKSRREKARGGSWRRGGADALLGRGPGAVLWLNPGGADLCAAELRHRGG